ncbi:hypothetical protein D3C76_1430240 [compost metagenome]
MFFDYNRLTNDERIFCATNRLGRHDGLDDQKGWSAITSEIVAKGVRLRLKILEPTILPWIKAAEYIGEQRGLPAPIFKIDTGIAGCIRVRIAKVERGLFIPASRGAKVIDVDSRNAHGFNPRP